MSAEPSAEVIGSLADASDPLVGLAELLIERAQQADPAFAEIVRVAAVPRKFDAALLAELTNTSADDGDFRRVFELLRALPFVTSRRDGRLRLHNEIRRALLARYELTDADRETLRALNERVAELYDAEHERARRLSDQLGLVDDILRRASPHRVPAIRAACEDRLIRPLIEAQHHRTVIDPVTSGFDNFETTFQRYETENRLGVLRMLLNTFQSDVARLRPSPGEDERDRAFAGLDHWLVYYSSRLRFAEGEYDEALTICRQVLAQPALDPRLRAWSLSMVSNACIASGRFTDALEAIAAELAAREESDPDPWNRPLIHVREANVHEMLWDTESQAASLTRALEAARDVRNTDMENSTLYKVAAVLSARGDVATAAEHAVQGLHTTRTTAPKPEQFWECAWQLMAIFGDRDPRLGDLFHAEARALFRGEPIRTLITENSYIDALKASGQFERAHTALDSLDAIVRDLRPDDRSTVDIARANLLDSEGREREAVERNRRTVQEARAQRKDRWSVAAAITNAATTEMLLGDLLDDAADSAAAGREMWTQMGHERGVALTEVVRAEVYRRRSQYANAETVLTAHPPLPAGSRPWLLWHLVRADVEIDIGELYDAAGHLDTIVDEQVRIGDLSSAATAAARAVQINLRAARLADAQRSAERLGALMTTLAGIWSYRYSPDQEQADQHNARAVRELSTQAPRPFDALREAIQNLDEAIKLDPATCWYPFNQAYAYMRLGDRKSALRTWDRAKELAPAPFAAAIARLDEPFAAWTPDVVR